MLIDNTEEVLKTMRVAKKTANSTFIRKHRNRRRYEVQSFGHELCCHCQNNYFFQTRARRGDEREGVCNLLYNRASSYL